MPDPGDSPKWLLRLAETAYIATPAGGERLIGLVKQSRLESDAVYGYRKNHRNLRDGGEACGKH